MKERCESRAWPDERCLALPADLRIRRTFTNSGRGVSKIPFDKDRSAKLPLDQRGVVALEHIAHYLDRIEGHLKKLSKAAEGDGLNSQTAVSAKVIGGQFRRP